MPFEITVDADAVLKQFDELQQNINGLQQQTSETFLLWQREDMHRHFPKVEGSGLSVSTMIYPRSRLPRPHHATGKSTRRRSVVAVRRSGSHRPILRPELFEQLKQRMIAMVQEACKWH